MEEFKVRREFKIPPILSKIWHDKELVKKILITLGIVIVYRLIAYVPLPGLNVNALINFFNNLARTQGGTLFGVMNIFGSGALERLTILALGLMPYISSCIIVQLLGAFIPFFKKYYVMGGQEGREKIVKSTYCLTITLSAIQAFFISVWLENPSRFQGLSLVVSPGWGFRVTTVLSIVAGVLLLLWLAKLINNYGIGNGIAILVVFGILSRVPTVVYQLVVLHKNYQLTGNRLILLLLVLVASVAVIWLITKSTQKIPIKYNNAKTKNSITLRFSWAGKVPLGFAQSIILFPATIAALTPSLNNFATQFSKGGGLYTILHSILVVFFTYFYIAVVFRPREIANNMRRYNCQIENVAAEKEAEKYLDAKMTKNTMITALFLIAVALLPGLYGKVFGLPYLVIAFIGGASLLIIIGVFYDLKCQIESHFAMKESNKGEWGIAYIAFDEIEAEIKKGFLETKEIPCVIEPLRFTWGMPIRTAVDQYRLYTPIGKREGLKKLLG